MSAPGRRPYETERAAMAAMHAAIPPEHDRVILTQEQRQQYLYGVLEAAGVTGLSAFESRTAWWLCGWEDYTVAIIARWVEAAGDARPSAPRTVTIDLGDDEANVFHVISTALSDYIEKQAEAIAAKGGNSSRERWMEIASEIGEDIVAAMDGGARS